MEKTGTPLVIYLSSMSMCFSLMRTREVYSVSNTITSPVHGFSFLWSCTMTLYRGPHSSKTDLPPVKFFHVAKAISAYSLSFSFRDMWTRKVGSLKLSRPFIHCSLPHDMTPDLLLSPTLPISHFPFFIFNSPIYHHFSNNKIITKQNGLEEDCWSLAWWARQVTGWGNSLGA